MAIYNLKDGTPVEITYSTFQKILPIRQVALEPDGTDPNRCTHKGDNDPRSIFLLASINGEPVATRSIVVDRNKIGDVSYLYRFRSFAVVPEWQQKGLSKLLLRSSWKACDQHGITRLWSTGRKHWKTLYESYGATQVDDPGYRSETHYLFDWNRRKVNFSRK